VVRILATEKRIYSPFCRVACTYCLSHLSSDPWAQVSELWRVQLCSTDLMPSSPELPAKTRYEVKGEMKGKLFSDLCNSQVHPANHQR